MTKKKAEAEIIRRRPRESLADKAVEEYGEVVARQHRQQEATKKAENTFHNALTALTEITEEVKFWENHPAVREMLDATEEEAESAEGADES